MLDFEVKLWEDGTIDLLYGSNPANPGDGRLATVGIENATGTDALQIGFLERVLPSRRRHPHHDRPDRLRRRHRHGRQRRPADRRRDRHRQPGGRHATTADDGTYRLRLRPGTYSVTASADLYADASTPAIVADDATTTADFSLTAPTAASDTTAITATVDYGQTAHRPSPCRTAARPLAWEARERTGETVFPPLPEPTSVVKRSSVWGHQATPKGVTVIRPRTRPGAVLDTIINDPIGDAQGSVDVGTFRRLRRHQLMSMALDFSPSTPIDQASATSSSTPTRTRRPASRRRLLRPADARTSASTTSSTCSARTTPSRSSSS